MAIMHAIPELWSASILRGFETESVLRNSVTDVSAQFPDGDTLHLNEITGTITVRDYAVNTDIQDPEVPDDTDLTMTIDKQKYYNIYVDDVHRVQARPAVLSEFGRQAAKKLTDQVDTDIYDVIKAAVPAGNQVDFPKASLPADVSTTTQAQRQALVDALLLQVKAMNDANWPRAGRFAMIGSYVEYMLLRYLAEKGIGDWVGAGEAQRSAALGNMFGVSFILDYKNDTQLQTTNDPVVLFGLREATYFAMQIRRTEAYRPEKRFGDAVKGLAVYGTKVVHDDALRMLKRSA